MLNWIARNRNVFNIENTARLLNWIVEVELFFGIETAYLW